MKHIELVTKDVLGSVSQAEIDSLQAAGKDGLAKLINGTGAGNDYLGWVTLPRETSSALLDDINATAASLRENCEAVVAIGIGGSYLGAKAVIEAMQSNFAAYEPAKGCRVFFAGQNIGEDYLAELQAYLSDKNSVSLLFLNRAQQPSLLSLSASCANSSRNSLAVKKLANASSLSPTLPVALCVHLPIPKATRHTLSPTM